jgi:HK97 family phage portal protein
VQILGLDSIFGKSESGVTVTIDAALGVPAVFAAVNFIAATVAGLPLHTYRRDADGSRTRQRAGVAQILHGAVNPETTSYAWRKSWMEAVLTGGRGVTFIERNANGRVINLWPLDPAKVTVKREWIEGALRTRYYYQEGKRQLRYEAAEVLDLTYMLKSDGLSARSPIMTCREAVALSIAAANYGARYFSNGGVPPFAVTGNFQTTTALQRAAEDFEAAISSAAKDRRMALTLPQGLDIKQIGANPEQGQLEAIKRFAVEEIARVYSLPPVFLQDLTRGTYSNTEQQDLQLVKHTLRRWLEQIEQELNLKLFGRGGRQFCEFNVDGLLRGDFKTRMEGHAQAIQNGIETPNEARQLENRPPLEGGDSLMIQGATVPITAVGGAGAGAGEEGQDDGQSQEDEGDA